ncbi:MAG: HlyD family efflux transporter periplasmic adaptor subunit [Saprospiraceae bacterium]|nr:HlyD family efflux transporter periplasmic adaptor subunit [Saprospiraceae bacterium]
MKILNFTFISFVVLGIISCTNGDQKSDAYGNFEANELIVSSEMPGKILQLDVEEGIQLKQGQLVGLVDTVLLQKQKNVIAATIRSIDSKTQSQAPEIEVLTEQRSYLLTEKKRVIKLIEGNAATQKQLDDLESQITVIDKKITATKVKYYELNKGVLSQKSPLYEQLKQLEEQINKSKLINPVDGQILSVYKRTGEVTGAGMPLYKIADMSSLNLKAYITGAQIPHIKLNQKVEVLIDEDEKTNRKLEGEVIWISSKAEFTPKTIQTKEERVSQVYAIKVKVNNDGSLKIGMPGEVRFGK